ncbi:Spx/MgsR family RNA polymerase-binding regulatory protein [Dyadobacter sp. CY343]|uniref:Spx/MgsR family RNA polymerase-binding regulatory protein n=1 Tax=Dyadobacter sp. CY343 TaxID=2907299 RepID=UPI001F40B0F4|nr:Spx/MgsR family RNA polymerase-binding regulatory protein [Dyadobacter sp. CY343]MCE7058989.1 Spx/MgsR family RNA polymerase-binding regulatory protein [Dyadobacter sp. CY343]
MLTLYGIPNCDTIKKARTWLEKNNIAYTFYDYRKEPISTDKVEKWFKVFPWEKVINKASTTWKELSAEEKLAVTDEKSAAKLAVAHTTVIKRPVVEDASGKAVTLGFSEKIYEETFLK